MMVFVIKGKAKAIFKEHGCNFLFKKQSDKQQIAEINDDIDAARFIGDRDELQEFRAIWRKGAQVHLPSYAQGNINGANLSYLFGENFSSDASQTVNVAFAYMDDEKRCCSLFIKQNKEKPEEYVIGVVTNTNLALDKQEIHLISTVPSRNGSEVATSPSTEAVNELRKHTGSERISNIIEAINDDEFQHANILNLISQPVGNDRQPQDIAILGNLREIDKTKTILNNRLLQKLADENFAINTVRAEHVLDCLDEKGMFHDLLSRIYGNKALSPQNTDDYVDRRRDDLIELILQIYHACWGDLYNELHHKWPDFAKKCDGKMLAYQASLCELAYAQFTNKEPKDRRAIQQEIQRLEQPLLLVADNREEYSWLRRRLAIITLFFCESLFGKNKINSLFFPEMAKVENVVAAVEQNLLNTVPSCVIE